MLGVRELLIILAIVLVVFGTKRLISAGGDLGKAIQSFKKGMKDAQDEPAKLDPPAPQPGVDSAVERKDTDRPGS
ncbi:MAG: twin-arginine translocase TatA/TatE family subunit [Silanimonas sp.]|jgi:sec-independent protein translocase protein TatA